MSAASPAPSPLIEVRNLVKRYDEHVALAGSVSPSSEEGRASSSAPPAQVAKREGRSVFAFTRPGDVATQAFARSLGVKCVRKFT